MPGKGAVGASTMAPMLLARGGGGTAAGAALVDGSGGAGSATCVEASSEADEKNVTQCHEVSPLLTKGAPSWSLWMVGRIFLSGVGSHRLCPSQLMYCCPSSVSCTENFSEEERRISASRSTCAGVLFWQGRPSVPYSVSNLCWMSAFVFLSTQTRLAIQEHYFVPIHVVLAL